MTHDKSNPSAVSVRQRLLNLSRERGEEFQLLLTRFALERLLGRIARSQHKDRFVLKGAMLFAMWTDDPHRATKDLDLLGHGNNTVDAMVQLFVEICEIDVPDEGLEFLADSVEGARIKEDQEYEAVRVRLLTTLAGAQIRLQIDIGFGDAVHPQTTEVEYPVLLDFPRPRIRAYRMETVVAEKFHAMVTLGIGNSRMKDFYDVWILARQFSFSAAELRTPIRRTFDRRQTPVPTKAPLAITQAFAGDDSKMKQWAGFIRKGRLRHAPPELGQVANDLCTFLLPVLQGSLPAEATWIPGGPWQQES